MGNEQCLPKIRNGVELNEDEISELVSLSGFTDDQIREWHIGFLKDCPTGKLSKRKFIDIYKQFYPTGKAEKFCEYVFRTFDNDSSGNIDFSEFLVAISISAQQNPHKKLEWAFSMYDMDRNGFIEKKEVKKILEAIFDILGEEKKDAIVQTKVDQILNKFDTNGDGKLSKDEFIAGCLEDDCLRKLLAPSVSLLDSFVR